MYLEFSGRQSIVEFFLMIYTLFQMNHHYLIFSILIMIFNLPNVKKKFFSLYIQKPSRGFLSLFTLRKISPIIKKYEIFSFKNKIICGPPFIVDESSDLNSVQYPTLQLRQHETGYIVRRT